MNMFRSVNTRSLGSALPTHLGVEFAAHVVLHGRDHVVRLLSNSLKMVLIML